MAVIAGSLFSVNFDPVTYLQQDCDNPQDGEFEFIMLSSQV